MEKYDLDRGAHKRTEHFYRVLTLHAVSVVSQFFSAVLPSSFAASVRTSLYQSLGSLSLPSFLSSPRPLQQDLRFSLKDDDNPSLCSSTSLSICKEKNWEITILKTICRPLKMNVIAYHNGQSEGKYPKEPMRTQSKKQTAKSAGKRGRPSRKWF